MEQTPQDRQQDEALFELLAINPAAGALLDHDKIDPVRMPEAYMASGILLAEGVKSWDKLKLGVEQSQIVLQQALMRRGYDRLARRARNIVSSRRARPGGWSACW